MISQGRCRLELTPSSFPVLSVEGEIDCCNVDMFRTAAESVAGSQAIVLDFERADYVDSAVLNVVIGLAKRQHELRRYLLIVAPRTTHIRRIFNITGIDELVPVSDSLDEALKPLRLAARGN